MRQKLSLFVLTVMLFGSTYSNAQTDIYGLNIYGFFQTSFSQRENKTSIPILGQESVKSSNTFWFQQMNLFFSKNINENFSAFVNLEFTNSFASQKNWGGMKIEEAWMRYRLNNSVYIKGGLLIPKFNNLNEIKNRTILLPYVFRPLVYETSVASLSGSVNFIPQSAHLTVYGTLSASNTKFDYSVYVGNSEDAYINSNSQTQGIPSTDSTKFKLFGGRLGVRYKDLRVGVSTTFDRHNQQARGLGDLKRIRFGADLGYSIAGFDLEAEYIKVNHNLTDAQNDRLTFLGSKNPMMPKSFDKEFYYANLTYNINDSWYIYYKYDFIKDQSSTKISHGLTGNGGGFGYRPTDDIVIKAQYQILKTSDDGMVHMNVESFYIGASVLF